MIKSITSARSVGRTWGCAFLAVAAASCGTIRTGDPEIPPTPGQDLTPWLEPLGTDGGHEFYLRNDSELIYRITRVTLTDCKNVRECGEHRLDVVVCPGETRRVFASRPFEADHRVERERVFFNWSFGATSYEAGEPVVGADCGPGEP